MPTVVDLHFNLLFSFSSPSILSFVPVGHKLIQYGISHSEISVWVKWACLTKHMNDNTLVNKWLECKSTPSALECNGTKAEDEYGVDCMSWSVTEYRLCTNAERNYCRNMDNDEYGPWCYVKSSNIHREKSYCDIEYYDIEINSTKCRATPGGISYAGRRAYSETNQECLQWINAPSFVFNSVNNALLLNNYCRNFNDSANKDKYPWCFIEQDGMINSDYCVIPLCSEAAAGSYAECKINRQGLEYKGKLYKTHDGHVCFPWYRFIKEQ